MEASNGWALWLVLAVAAVVGYFLVSKIIDFYTKGSTFEKEVFTEDPESTERIGGHDPNKPIG